MKKNGSKKKVKGKREGWKREGRDGMKGRVGKERVEWGSQKGGEDGIEEEKQGKDCRRKEGGMKQRRRDNGVNIGHLEEAIGERNAGGAGCAWKTGTRLTASCRYWGICVVFPEPVSPSMMSTWWSRIASMSSCRNG